MATNIYGNRIKVNTATAGTGTVTLGAASSNAYCTFAEAGIADGSTVTYVIEEGNDFEIGTGVYTSSGTTLTRATVYLSKISGSSGTTKMTLAGAATVRVDLVNEGILDLFRSFTGTATNDSAAAGKVGEYVTAALASASAVSLTTNVAANVTSISLTAGDWEVYAQIDFLPAATTTVTALLAGITDTTAVIPASAADSRGLVIHRCASFTPVSPIAYPVNTCRISINSTTSIFLNAQATFATSTMKAFGYISARRMR